MSEYIYYKVGDKRAKVRTDKQAEFESQHPDAKVYYTYQGRNAAVPISGVDAFKEKYGANNVSYAVLDDFKSDSYSKPATQTNSEVTSTEADDRTSVFETIGKGLGAAGVGTAKLALDLGQNLWQQTLGRLDDQTLDETIQNEDNAVTRASMKLGELQERLSREADPTGGQQSFVDLIKHGKIGMAAQKALGSGLESLPMMLAAGTGLGALLYGTAMAAGQYADETRDDDDIPAWKRGVNALGSAALEMAVEKIGGPLKNLGGKAGKEFSEEMAKEILEDFAKEGTEKVAKRIFDVLKKPLKEGLEEGGEEVLTSFGNDALGSALDMIDGDKDYGIHAQWEQMKEENPDADLGDFAKSKANEYFDSFLGGALSGMEIAGTTDAIRLGVSNSQKNQVQQAKTIGSSLGLQDMYDVDHQLVDSGNEVEKAFTGKDGKPMLSRDFIDGITSDEAYELSRSEDFSPYQRKALLWHAKSKAIQEGLTEKMDTELNNRISSQNSIINEAQSDGVVVTGFYNNQPVYVKGAVAKNGTVTLEDGSNGPVMIINQMTGEKATVRTEDIKMSDSVNADEYRARIETQLKNNDTHNREMWRNRMSFSAKFRDIQQYAGSKITINASNGLTEVEVLNINPETGKVLIKGKKGDLGQSELQLDADLFYDSIARNEDGTPVYVEKLPQKEQAPETPVAETTPEPQPEQPVTPEGPQDFREYVGPMVINGVPVNVEVMQQDDTADRVDYTFVDENGVRRSGSTTVAGFAEAVQQAGQLQTEAPVVETPPTENEPVENVVPEPAPAEVTPTTETPVPQNVTLKPEDIDWDALFDTDQEAFFAEMQNQFGDKSERYFKAFLAAAQKELDKLEKSNPTQLKDIVANEARKDALQARIEALNGMIARIATPAPEVAPTTPTVPATQLPTDNVPDVSVDKAADARARGFRMTNGQRVDRRGETAGAYGNDTEVAFTADSKGKRAGKVKVIDASNLIPSHISGVENVEHFLPEAQQKKRTDAASTVSATLIAQNMDNPKMTNVASSAYEGAPIVNKRGEVIQGNNRSAAILEMYQTQQQKAAEYKQYLIDHAAEFGLNAEEVAAMQNPVLVRELDVDDADAITLGQYTMQDMESGGSQMIDSGRAIAGLSNKGLLEDFITRLLAEENEETSDMNLSDLITRNGNEALNMLYQNGIINQTQYQSALGANGRITADARAALRGIIEQQLFAGGIDNLSVMFEVLPDKAKKAIMQTISRDLKNPDDAKVTPYLQEAIEIYYQLNQQPDFVAAKTKEEVDNAVELFKGQTSLDETGTPAEKYSNFAFDLAKKFKTLTLKQQRDMLNHLYEVIAGEVNIFGESEGKPLSEAVAEVYGTNLNKGNNETNGQSGAAVLEGGNGGSQDGQQGSTGNVGVRPETGESWQGTTNGGANPAVGGSTQATGEVTPVAPNPVANPVDAAKAKERRLKNIIARYDLTPEHKYDLAVQIGKEIGDFFATIEEYESFEEIATDFGAEYNKAVREGVDKSFAERTLNTGNSQEKEVTLGAEPKEENNGTQEATTTGESNTRQGDSGGVRQTSNEGGEATNEGAAQPQQQRKGENKGNQKVEDKYPARKKNATGKMLIDTFGFNSVTIPDSRKDTLNAVYDFMMEMAKILGISPKSIGMGGMLDVGTLRSNARNAAEHGLSRIKMTKAFVSAALRFKYAKLLGIAHEWWHALDNALVYFDEGKAWGTATEVTDSQFSGRKETLDAVRAVMQAIEDSGYKTRIRSLVSNPRALAYYFDPTEMAARAFDVYIRNKFVEAGISVNGVSYDYIDSDLSHQTPEEMEVITPAIENLLSVLQEKAGKKPNTSILYHIGQEVDQIENERRVSEEAINLTNEAIDISLEGANIDVERPSDEQTKEVLALGGIENQFSVETDKPIFISNAALAVQGIKMEKATPEQWLKMIEKAGGLKAGEDKWMRLSDWLKASDKKTLTKQEVLDYINENTIQIEEEHYSESAEDNATIVYGQMRDILQGEFNHYRAEYYEEHEDDDFYGNPAADYAIEKLRNYFGDTQFPYDIEVDYSGDVYFTFYHEDNADMEKWAKKLGVKYEPQNPINSTRQMYTSDGLENKKEIALIVPTIKSWGEWDDVHFGDAGKGRAVAWVRFGDTEVIEETEESKEIVSALHELANDARQKYGEKRSAWPDDVRAAYDMLLESQLDSMRHRKILVIDEIQSKRHQEGRDKGYSMSIEEYEQRLNALETERAERLKRRTILLKQLKEKYGDDFNSYLKLQDTAYVPNENVMTPEEVQEWYATTQDEIDSAIDNLKKEMRTGIPAAPFEKNWPELAMKRMLRYAAENGYDEVAWTSGKQQSDRYNLGKVVNSIISADNGETKRVRIFLKNSDSLLFDVDSKTGKVVSVHQGDMVSVGANLSDVVGKDMADGILNNTGAEDNEGRYHWSGEGLRVGTSGMAAFYDKMLPAFMSKYGKKWGVSVSETELPLVEAGEGYTFHSVPVTEAMKASVMEGQPMFYKTPNGIVYGWTDGKKIYLTKAGMNPNTKIHEYTHLWAKAMMQKNTKGWDSIKQLLKKSPVWKQVMNDANYSNIHGNEDMVTSEVLSRLSGTNNAAKLEQMAQKMLDEAKGTGRKLEARGLIQNMKDALNKFWNWVGTNLFGIENFESVEQVTDRVLYDLINKTDLGELSEGQVETQIVGNPATPTQVARETAAQTYDRVVNEDWQEFQRQFQDAFQPVRIAIDAIQQETGNIPIEDYENYLLIQNQMSSRSRVEIDNFSRRYYTPIIKQVNAIIDKIMESRGLRKSDKAARAEIYKEVRQYLIAKHGLERNKYYQEHKTRTMTAKEMKPLLDEAEKDYQTEVNVINMNNNLTDAERELQLRDALDVYNATVQEIKTREVPDLRDYSGLTSLFGLESKEWEQAEEMAQELVDNFENSLGRENNEDGEMITQSEEIDALWKRINAATNKTLRHSYESGMLSRQQYNEIKEMFKFYIPLRGFDETTAEDVYSYARFEGNRFNAAVHKAEGRTSVADDPLAIIMNMAESEIAQGNKNRAKQALYNYLLNRASAMNDQNSLMQLEDVWYLIDVDEDGNKTYQIVTPDHASGETYEEFENKMQALAEEGRAEKSRKGKLDIGYRFQKQENRNAHYVFVKINGVEKAIYINGDPKAADAINGRYQKELGTGIKLFRDIQRVISSTFTNYSLEFTARNYFRDMIYSHINIGIRESDPAYRKKFRQNWRHNNMGAMMRMLKAYRAGEYDGVALTEDEAAFVEFMENGGQTGYTLINSVENHKKDLQRAIERMQSGIEKGGVKDSTIFKATLGSIELLNEASELVTRFAAYKTSRDMGRGINSSIKDAKEVTVNFNTKGAQDGQGWMGAVARYFGWSKFFFNASVQGVQNLKSMRDANKLKFGTVVGGVVATGFFMPIFVSVVSELLGGDDEEEYWNIPEYERQNNFCIPLGNGKYAKVPLPIGFREVYAIGDMVAASLMDKRFNRNAGEVGMDITNKIASIVLPVNPLESMSTGLNMWQTFLYTGLPSSAQVLIQNATNTDWKGTPLQKEYTYNENDPKWMKAFASNPDWMKGLSKWCNEHINLDGDYKGMDWSPEKLENTLSNLGGGIYSLIKKSGKTLSMIWNEENRNLSNVPLAGVVLGSGVDSDDRFVTDAYFDMKDFYDANLNYIKRRAEQFGYDLEDVFLKEKGKHQPKMLDIYQNRNFDFMQEWYKGNKELEEMNREIKKLKKEIAAKEKPSTALLNKLAKKQDEFNAERSDFVNDMLELD